MVLCESPGPISCFGAARHDELSLPPEMLNISSDGRWTGGEQHGEVFITEQSVLGRRLLL